MNEHIEMLTQYQDKKNKECVLLYPDECIPTGKTLDDVVKLFSDEKTVIYMEIRAGIKPTLMGSDIEKAKVKFIKYQPFPSSD